MITWLLQDHLAAILSGGLFIIPGAALIASHLRSIQKETPHHE